MRAARASRSSPIWPWPASACCWSLEAASIQIPITTPHRPPHEYSHTANCCSELRGPQVQRWTTSRPADTSEPGPARRPRVLHRGLVDGGYWFIHARHFETTDDAYVNGDVVQVSSQQPGTVLGVHVDDTQTVAAGTGLVELDPADADVAMSNAEDELARSVRQGRGLVGAGGD